MIFLNAYFYVFVGGSKQGGNSTYEFNLDDYEDPFPAEVIQSELEKRGPEGLPLDKDNFFSVEDAATKDF